MNPKAQQGTRHMRGWNTYKKDEHVGVVTPPTNDTMELATRVPFEVVFEKSKMLASRKLSPAPSARTFFWLGLTYI